MIEIPQYLINWGLFLCASCVGWWCRQIWDQQKEMARTIAALELKVVGEYAPNTDLHALKAEIVGALTRIEAKLDSEISRNR